MKYKAKETLKPMKFRYKKTIPYNFKHWWIIKGQVFKTKEIDGSQFIVTTFGKLICRVNSAYQQMYFEIIN